VAAVRPIVGFLAANAALLIAGMGVLLGLGYVKARIVDLLAAGGLAFLCGVSTVMVLAMTALVVGLPMSLWGYTVICALVAVGGCVLAWRRAARGAMPAGLELHMPTSRLARFGLAATAIACIAVFVVLVISAREASVLPVSVWDEFAMWSKKAVFLVDYDTLDPRFFAGAAYVHMHQEYPILLPLLEAFVARGMGSTAARPVHTEFVVLFVAFLWALTFLAWRRRPSFAWVPVILGIAVSPWIWDQLLTGYADLPVTFLLGIGVLSLGLWLEDRRPAHLAVATVLLAGAANTKMEGLVAAVAALLVAGVLNLAQQRKRQAVSAALALVVVGLAVLPWRIWTSVHNVHLYLDVGKGFDLNYLWDQRHTATGALRLLGTDLADQQRLLYVVPIALVLALLCWVKGVGGRLALFYLATALVQVFFLTWVNVIDPTSLSRGRSIDTIAVFAVVAVVHLASVLAEPVREVARGIAPATEASAPEVVATSVASRSHATLGATRGRGI
jgi:hypothetical protein